MLHKSFITRLVNLSFCVLNSQCLEAYTNEDKRVQRTAYSLVFALQGKNVTQRRMAPLWSYVSLVERPQSPEGGQLASVHLRRRRRDYLVWWQVYKQFVGFIWWVILFLYILWLSFFLFILSSKKGYDWLCVYPSSLHQSYCRLWQNTLAFHILLARW